MEYIANVMELIKANPTMLKLTGVAVLYLFLPFTTLSYILFRHYRTRYETDRIFEILGLDHSQYKEAYRDRMPYLNFFLAITYISVVSIPGLTLLFSVSQLKDFPLVDIGGVDFPAHGSLLVFVMAFLGAYIWSLQHIFRRYSVNDLRPSVYYRLGSRMILASIIALVTFNAYEALSGGGNTDGGVTSNIWPAIAFIIGMFPRRGLNLLTERIPFVAPVSDPTVPKAPLEMIEGITIHDRMRFEEQGIDTCYDLATADFVPLILKTPYGARELVDWILQAKLCVHFGESVKELRRHGIRTALDLNNLDLMGNTEGIDIDKLASEIALTKTTLQLAKKSIERDPEIDRLCTVGQKLGQFTTQKTDNPK